MTMTAADYARALRDNAEAFHQADVSHAEFSAVNKAIWKRVEAAGPAVHERVLELLRRNPPGVPFSRSKARR